MSDTTWAIVVNPTKFDDLPALRERVATHRAGQGWTEPRWYETTAEDPGTGQAAQAIADGATLVCPLGGDGTVRSVATALLDSPVSLGLLPGGTGNLLARNLSLPIDNLEAALTIAMTGVDTGVDAGMVSFDEREPELFLVMAGMGLDAEAVGGASTQLKRRFGWMAYAVSGVKGLVHSGFTARVAAGGQRAFSQNAATVMIGNCGELTAGVRLMPDARVDDGLLDVAVVSPRSLGSWMAVGAYIVTRHRVGHSAIALLRGPEVTVFTTRPVEAQLDGDVVGPVTSVTCSVRPGALTVRVAA